MHIIGYNGSYTYSRKPTISRASDYGPGMYFASDPVDAKNYGAYVYQAEITLNNPLVAGMEWTPQLLEFKRWFRMEDEDLEFYLEEGKGAFLSVMGHIKAMIEYVGMYKWPAVTEKLKKLGYDSIYVPNAIIKLQFPKSPSRGEYLIVFDQSQIVDWKLTDI